jgi:inorganic pyrophosphatase/exopolyphosphatase
MKIITTGNRYLDIDGYASMVAYGELLDREGVPAVVASGAPFNASITDEIREWPVDIRRDYQPSADDERVVVDASDPEYLMGNGKIVEVIDHHPGFEEYWRERLGDKAIIEQIGAVATLIYEKWVEAGRLSEMSQTSARLLICGILDNTLDFNAGVTTDRDRRAYAKLKPLAKFETYPQKWYFESVDKMIQKDLAGSIKNDVKPNMPILNGLTIGQLMLWGAPKLIDERRAEIEQAMNEVDERWLINLISLSDKHSYFLTSDAKTASEVADLLDVKFNNDLAVADKLWLRKEILGQGLKAAPILLL